MSSTKLLVGICTALVLVIAGLGGYYLYSSGVFEKLSYKSPFGGSNKDEGGESLQVSKNVEFKNVPKGWKFIYCYSKYYHLNPPTAPDVDCTGAKPTNVAISIYEDSQDLYKTLVNNGAKITKENIQVGGKDALVIEKTYIATVVLLDNNRALHIVLNNPDQYKKEYDELVSRFSLVNIDEHEAIAPPPTTEPEATPVVEAQTEPEPEPETQPEAAE